MKTTKYKATVDILSILLSLTAIITGFKLHREVWHTHVYDDRTLWQLHEFTGLFLMLFITFHCIQHSLWFKKLAGIASKRKRLTAFLLVLALIVAVTGVILMSGSRSEAVSHIHYAGGILFIAVAIIHVAKRWKIFRSFLR